MNNNEAIGRIRFLLDVGGSDGFTSTDKEALNMAINALSRVRHGQWIKLPESCQADYECSECGAGIGIVKPPYCAYCGAKMGKEGVDNV